MLDARSARPALGRNFGFRISNFPPIHPRIAHRLVLSERSESNGFLDSAFGFARNDTFLAFPTSYFDRAPKPVIPTEGAERPSGGIYGGGGYGSQ